MRTTDSDARGAPRTGLPAAVPEPPATVVHLPRITSMLDAGTLRPVTLLSAPAGWGKTVALASWLTSSPVAAPVAWLSLESGDDGTHFWSKLDTALADAAGSDARGAAPAPLEGPEALAQWLCGQPRPLRLVLDDLHVVKDPGVLDGIDLLVRRSAGQLRLVIAARTDPDLPLHRWRLRGDLTELRVDDLAFSLDETAHLLARHGIELPAPQLRALHRRTEGWAAGLQLAALAMRGRVDAARIAATFSGEDEGVVAYLEAEVLAQFEPHVRDLLIASSVVDSVCGELADALTDREDSDQRLDDLRRASAFLVPVEGCPAWYRFHHLFGEMLRARLRRYPSRSRQLHGHAAAWYASHGLAIDALRHALAAGDGQAATTVLREHWPDLALCGCHDHGPTELASRWRRLAPADGDGLALAYAAERLDARDVNTADRLLQFASQQRPPRGEDSHWRSTDLAAAALRLARARMAGDGVVVVSAAGELLDRIEDADDDVDAHAGVQFDAARSIALTTRGIAQLGLGDVPSAGDSFAAAASVGGAAGADCSAVLCGGGLALVQALRGKLHHAEELAQGAIAAGPCPGQHPCQHCEPAYLALALVHHEWNRGAEATRFLDLARRSRDLSADCTLAAWSVLIRARLLLAGGVLDEAHMTLLEGRRTPAMSSPQMARWFAATEAELRIAWGQAHAVPATLTALLDDDQAMSTPVSVALAHAHLRNGDVHAAARALPQWTEETKAEPLLTFRLDAGLVEAVTARRLGDARRAAATLERVLQLAEVDGFRRVFVNGGQEVRELLAEQLECGTAHWSLVRDLVDAPSATADAPPGPSGGVHEALTDRELTVLRYLQSILSNQEIASKLFVSVNTVKTHVRNIYRKLDVARRRDAVRRARELHVL